MTIDRSKWHSWVIKFHLGQSPVGVITQVTLMCRVCVCGINTGCCTPATLLCSKWRCNQRQPEKLAVYKKDKEKADSLFDTVSVFEKKIILSRIIIKSLYARLPCLLFLLLFMTPFYEGNKIAIKRAVFCQCSFPFLLILYLQKKWLWCSLVLKLFFE